MPANFAARVHCGALWAQRCTHSSGLNLCAALSSRIHQHQCKFHNSEDEPSAFMYPIRARDPRCFRGVNLSGECPAAVQVFCPATPPDVTDTSLDCLFHQNPLKPTDTGYNKTCPCPGNKAPDGTPTCTCLSACALTGCPTDAACGIGRTCSKRSSFHVCLFPWDAAACGPTGENLIRGGQRVITLSDWHERAASVQGSNTLFVTIEELEALRSNDGRRGDHARKNGSDSTTDDNDDATPISPSSHGLLGAAPPNLTSYTLPDPAVCINGCPATVSAAVQDPSIWVITLGGLSAPGGAGWCVSEEACAWEASQPWNATINRKAHPSSKTGLAPLGRNASAARNITCAFYYNGLANVYFRSWLPCKVLTVSHG